MAGDMSALSLLFIVADFTRLKPSVAEALRAAAVNNGLESVDMLIEHRSDDGDIERALHPLVEADDGPAVRNIVDGSVNSDSVPREWWSSWVAKALKEAAERDLVSVAAAVAGLCKDDDVDDALCHAAARGNLATFRCLWKEAGACPNEFTGRVPVGPIHEFLVGSAKATATVAPNALLAIDRARRQTASEKKKKQ